METNEAEEGKRAMKSVLLVKLAFAWLCPDMNLFGLHISVNLPQLKIDGVDDIPDRRQDCVISQVRSWRGGAAVCRGGEERAGLEGRAGAGVAGGFVAGLI